MSATVVIVQADLQRSDHAAAIVALTDAYARDAMGNGAPLSQDVRARLVPGLQRHPTTIVLLAYEAQEPIGIANCFLGFSTFAARPLLNVHDLAVIPSHRGRGVGRRLLEAAEGKARELGCCKLTLEVLENNRAAVHLYRAAGFAQATYQESAGGALFMAKPL